MKKQFMLIMFAIFSLIGASNCIYGACNNDRDHKNPQVMRCWYAQKDIKKMRKKNKDRHKELGIEKGTCFYCGCSIEEHTHE